MRKREILIEPKAGSDETFDDVFEVALDLGAEDFEEIEFPDEFIPDKSTNSIVSFVIR